MYPVIGFVIDSAVSSISSFELIFTFVAISIDDTGVSIDNLTSSTSG